MVAETIRVDKVDQRYIARCTFHQREIPKQAGFRWDPADKVWWTNKPEVAARLASPEKQEELVRESEEKFKIRTQAIEASRAANVVDIHIPAPKGLEYLPYQKAGIARALTLPAVLFADEMGLGKTIQAIGVINTDETLKRVLVICPASLKLNWRNEMRRWLIKPKDLIVGHSQECPTEWAGGPNGIVLIINYDICHKHSVSLKAAKWDLVILDEAHYLKNPNAKRTIAVVGAAEKRGSNPEPAIPGIMARRRAALTGTPIPNEPIEAFPILHYLDPVEFKTPGGFKRKYCNGWTPQEVARRLRNLQDQLRATVMIRRLKADVLTELPAKRRAVIEVSDAGLESAVKIELDAWDQQQERLLALRAAVELAKASANPWDYKVAVDALKEAAAVAFTEISRIRHETAVATAPFVIDHVKSLIDQGEKLIVFAHHRDVLEKISKAFADVSVLVYGGMPIEQRQAAVERFQGDPACMVFVGGILAAGVGLTLTAAAHVVFAELDWVPGNVTQAEDRAHRIGQKEMVIVEHFVLEGSLAARMAHILVDKQEVIDRALDKVEASDEVPLPIAERERAASDGLTRAAIEKVAESLTWTQIEAIHQGLKLLAAMDGDRARTLNGMGFSKIDVAIGHSLAECNKLTPRQAALGQKLCNKYRRQLPEEMVSW